MLQASEMDKALAVLEEMQSLGFKPTLEIYSVLIEGERALQQRGRLCRRVCIEENLQSVLQIDVWSPARTHVLSEETQSYKPSLQLDISLIRTEVFDQTQLP
jgi:pentatricopeptide repeat protein